MSADLSRWLGKVTQGDCLEVLRGLPDCSVDIICTDPPYPNMKGGSPGNRGYPGGVAKRRTATTTVGTPWGSSLEWLPEAWRVARHGLLVFCSYHSIDAIPLMLPQASRVALLTWYKRNSPPTGTHIPRYTTEYIWAFRKESGLAWDRYKTTLFDVPLLQGGCMATERLRNPDGSTLHPTQKPVALMRSLLVPTNPEHVIMDPFGGSGTTGVAAVLEGRQFILIEQDPAYCEIARARIAEAQRNFQPQLMEVAT